LKKHKKIGFNRKYNSLGTVSYPYWLIFERIAPLIEVAGLFYFGFLIVNNSVKWDYAIAFMVMAYLFTVFFSIVTIVIEEHTYHQYTKKGIGIKLLKTAFLEPFINHPFILYAAIKGNIDYYFNKKIKWGEMTRKGMSNN
ncbi:MAG: glycosyltransferase family 2 protein, partial [Flavobacterium sp.]|nr:glycosyltransferase family 2 protein [Flavobacterium sp.]